MHSLDEILTVATFETVTEESLAIASSLGAPTTAFQEGDPILTQIMTTAQKVADLTGVAVEITKGGFGELLPSDDWADLWAQSRFNVERVAATSATGHINATNSSTTNYVLNPGDLTVAHATTGKTYRNQAAITILSGVGLSNILIAADETGTDSNAAPGFITTMVSSLIGVAVTNPAAVLGTDKETTAALVPRARAKLGALSPHGPKDVYRYVATTPEFSATSVPITRANPVLNPVTGTIDVYLATANGAPTAPDVVIVQTAFDAYAEPWGITATATAATELSCPITYQAWVRGSQLTTTQMEADVATALAEYFKTISVGGDVIPPDTGAIYPETLEQIIGRAVEGTVRVTVTIPAASFTLTTSEVAVLGTLTPTTTVLA